MLKHHVSAIQSLMHRRGQMSTKAIVFLAIGVVCAVFSMFALIGIALWFPAVQQVREAARQAEMNNKLKQIGLALQNYHEVHNPDPLPHIETDSKPVETAEQF